MSENEQGQRRRTALWVVLGCAVVVFVTSLDVFQVPDGGLDRLVYEMRSAERAGLMAQLIRISIVTAVFLCTWPSIARWIAKRYALDAERVIATKWRVLGWYLAFEAVLVINFIRIV